MLHLIEGATKGGLDLSGVVGLTALSDESARETVGGCLWPVLRDLFDSIFGEPPTLPEGAVE